MKPQINKHGLPVLTSGALFTEEEPRPKSISSHYLIKRGVPANLLARGLNTVKEHHYPTTILHKLQKGRCFYCQAEINLINFRAAKNPGGLVKGHLYPRSAHYTLYGNKILTCGSCHRLYKEQMPDDDQIAYFNWLYSWEVFAAEFGVKGSEGGL